MSGAVGEPGGEMDPMDEGCGSGGRTTLMRSEALSEGAIKISPLVQPRRVERENQDSDEEIDELTFAFDEELKATPLSHKHRPSNPMAVMLHKTNPFLPQTGNVEVGSRSLKRKQRYYDHQWCTSPTTSGQFSCAFLTPPRCL